MLKVPNDAVGRAVEPRNLEVADYQEAREVTIATITRPEVGLELFGPPSEARTYMLDVQVKVLRDVKSGSSDLTWLTVEVGQAGTYEKWQQFGLKGLRILKPGENNSAVQLSLSLERSLYSYDYFAPHWQAAATHFGMAYIRKVLSKGNEDDAMKGITIRHYLTHALVPLVATDSKTQSAFGLRMHYLITGVLFDSTTTDEADGLGTMQAPPFPLVGTFPTGQIDADGITPLTSDTVSVRVTYPRCSHGPSILDGHSYCVAAQEVYAAKMAEKKKAAAEGGQEEPPAPNWTTYRQQQVTQRNRDKRTKQAQGKAAAQASVAGVDAASGKPPPRRKGKAVDTGGNRFAPLAVVGSTHSWGGASSDAGSKRDRAEIEDGEIGPSDDEGRANSVATGSSVAHAMGRARLTGPHVPGPD